MYAPRIRRLTWNAAGAPRPMVGSFRVETWSSEGDPFPVEASYGDDATTFQTRNPLGVITWGAEGLYDSPAIQSDLSITLQDGLYHVTGHIRSETDLRDVALLMGNTAYNITLTQTIAQGTSVAISRPVTATYSFNGPYSNICGTTSYDYMPYSSPTLPSGSYNPVTSTGPCYLTAFIDTVPFPANDIGGVHVQESCLIYSIPCPAQPPGKVETTLENATTKTENGWVDTYTHIAYGNAPGTTFNYVMPVYLHIATIDKITVALLPAPEANILTPLKDIEEVAVWNWTTKLWMVFPPTEAETVLTGATARQAFDPQEGVRVRVAPTDNSFTVKLIITVEGTP